ncbi:GNAT family N-acetyltransferase [Flavobacterium silvisoli]|uniref:GNAT family N-acetyltransferase n=1 Tax=Flavobacterium silvisoli TaxID=2529433 RepID=A0A4V2L492_9FLAO|nr:GNAT family N-acetyltransferase [Flavobacterium silvisoli]TBX65791.1 GNAT family N-acetyltransferase [Flavobacterium silvisoli]
MMHIERNQDDEFKDIRAIAQEVWPIAYGSILSQPQLEYMMEMMYSVPALRQQAEEKKHHFILVKDHDVSVGFASYELNSGDTHKTKVHKIYILSTRQGEGIGKLLLDFILNEAKSQNEKAVFLNVNKYNPAQHFYQKLGFSTVKEEVIDIGNGYVMDDFVMEKSI